MSFHPLRFDRAAATYGEQAQIQSMMAETLIGLLPAAGVSPSGESAGILEMGCGTGLLTRRLRERFPDTALIATDAAPRMLEAARNNLIHEGQTDRAQAGRADKTHANPAEQAQGSLPDPAQVKLRWHLFEASGAETIPEEIRSRIPYALTASNALVQWFPRLEIHFRMVASLIAPGGSYLVSGFLRDNFPELNAILAVPPFSYPEYPGHDEAGIRAAAETAGLEVADFRAESLETVPASALAFLESIRGLGSARRPETKNPLTRSRLRVLLDRYQERYVCAGGVRATWKPWYAWLRKPAGTSGL